MVGIKTSDSSFVEHISLKASEKQMIDTYSKFILETLIFVFFEAITLI